MLTAFQTPPFLFHARDPCQVQRPLIAAQITKEPARQIPCINRIGLDSFSLLFTAVGCADPATDASGAQLPIQRVTQWPSLVDHLDLFGSFAEFFDVEQ